MLNTASSIATCLGRALRDSFVVSRCSGRITTVLSGMHSSFWAAGPPGSCVTRINPPNSEAARLSVCPSSSAPNPRRYGSFWGWPSSVLAASNPAAVAAALEPIPPPGGMRCRQVICKPDGIFSPTSVYTRWMACTMRLFSSRGKASAPSPLISSTRQSPANSTWVSFHRSSARPRQSKAGPKLAVLAGTRTSTTCVRSRGLPAFLRQVCKCAN